MDELLSTKPQKTVKEEIIFLLASAILRKQQRSQNKEPDSLDNSATSCMTTNTAENND